MRWLGPLAVLSGCAALIHEICWSRAAAFELGADAPAEAAILAATMGGLGLGALWQSRSVPGGASAWRRLAGLELAAALLSLLSPWLLSLCATPVFASGVQGWTLTALLSLVAILSFSPAALALGATWPVLVAVGRSVDQSSGRLYSWNLVGAFFGALGAGFFLLPKLGLQWSLVLAAGLEALVAGLLWRSAVALSPAAVSLVKSGPTDDASREHQLEASLPYAAALVLAAWTGARSLALEGLCARLLPLAIGGGAQTFAAILSMALLSLALGAWIASATPPRHRWTLLGLAELWTATLLAGLLWRWPTHLTAWTDALAEVARGGSMTWLRLRACAELVIPLMLPSGLALPALMSHRPAGQAGALYGTNSLAAVLGAPVMALVLVPGLGTFGATRVLAALSFLTALLLIPASPHSRLVRISVASLTLALGTLLFCSPWSMAKLSAGHYADQDPRQPDSGSRRIVFAAEGLSALVTVEDRREGNSRVLRTNGQIEGAVPIKHKSKSNADLATAITLGAIPSMLCPELESACLIGLGTGVTAGALTSFAYKSIDIVEIEGAVVEALRDPAELFDRANGKVLEDPRVAVQVMDGAAWLRMCPKRYSLIVSQPSDPWLSGAARLLTQDFYARARGALRDDGLFCQWLQLYSVDREALRSAIATLLSVFPECWAFLPPGRAELVLVCGAKPADVRELEERAKLRGQVRASGSGGEAKQFLSCFLAGPLGLAEFSRGAELETIDRPKLAARAADLLYLPASSAQERISELAPCAAELPKLLKGRPSELCALLRDCVEAMALQGRPISSRALAEASLKLAEGLAQPEQATETAEMRRMLGDIALKNATAAGLASEREALESEAITQWQGALNLDAHNVSARRSMAIYFLNRRDFDSAIAVLKPGLIGERAADAPLQFMLGRIYEARLDYQSAFQAYAAAGDYGQARARKAQVEDLAEKAGTPIKPALGPRQADAEVLIKGGRRLIRENEFKKAASMLRKAIKIDPDSPSAHFELARACAGGSAWSEALETLQVAQSLGYDEARCRLLKAELLERADRIKEALVEQEWLVAKSRGDRQSVTPLLALARLNLRLGQAEASLRAAEEAEALVPEHLSALALRGAALAALSRISEARACYQRFLALAPLNHPGRASIDDWLRRHP